MEVQFLTKKRERERERESLGILYSENWVEFILACDGVVRNRMECGILNLEY